MPIKNCLYQIVYEEWDLFHGTVLKCIKPKNNLFKFIIPPAHMEKNSKVKINRKDFNKFLVRIHALHEL